MSTVKKIGSYILFTLILLLLALPQLSLLMLEKKTNLWTAVMDLISKLF